MYTDSELLTNKQRNKQQHTYTKPETNTRDRTMTKTNNDTNEIMFCLNEKDSKLLTEKSVGKADTEAALEAYSKCRR